MKCQACNQETDLPFHCPYCGGQFCSVHRLPENHACPRIDFARAQRQGQVMTPQSYSSYQYSYNLGPQRFPRKNHITSSPKEVEHITVAAALIVAIGFSIGLYGNYFGGFSFTWTWDLMAAFAVIMAVSVLIHEMAHKIMAQRRGLWAEFRLTTWGVVLTFVSIFLPFRMIAPGAMMISGSPNSDDIVKISVAGPATNMILSAGILGVAFATFPSTLASMLFFAAYIDAFLAIFNLIPFGILDGYKIFRFDKKVWALAFAVSLVLTVIAVIYTF
jgi:Zn-dependent protease